MPRPLSFLLGLLAAALLIVVAFVLVASATGPRLASEARVAGLQAPVHVSLPDDEPPLIEAETERDLFAGLGYAHAVRHPWALAVWRQTATGRLSLWFAQTDALLLDLHVRELGLGSDARAAYERLPEDARAVLDAYAAGVNAAFAANRLDRSDAFVLLDADIEPWEGWHSLAVEHLLAFLATPALPTAEALAATGRTVSPELELFLRADAHLRAYLHLSDFSESLALLTADAEGPAVLARYVYGASALPAFEAVEVRYAGQRRVLATVPGTVALPAGLAADGSWALLPAGTTTLQVESIPDLRPTFDRVVLRDGREELVEAFRAPGLLVLGRAEATARPIAPPPDTLALEVNGDPITDANGAADAAQIAEPLAPGAWVLRWNGLGAGADTEAWLALLRGEEPSFVLWPGAGLRVAEGTATVLGAPALSEALPNGRVVGGSATARYVAERLAADDTLRPAPEALGTDARSLWAARLATPLVAGLGDPDSVSMDLRAAVAYLQGWQHRYVPESIGATVFEAWMHAFRTTYGALPNPEALVLGQVERTDTVMVPFARAVADAIAEARELGLPSPALRDTLETYPERADSLVAVARTTRSDTPDLVVLKQTLRSAVERLETAFGPAGASWRWDRVQRASLHHPAQPDTARSVPRPLRPLRLSPSGHPTTLAWGPSPALGERPPPAAWTGWISTASDNVFVRAAAPPRDARRLDPEPPPPPMTVLPPNRERIRSVRLLPIDA